VADWPGFAFGLRFGLRSLGAALAAGLVLGLWIAFADTWLFSPIVPASQHALFEATPFAARLLTIALLVLRDEVVLRLIVLGGLVWLFGRSSDAARWLAILFTALVAWPVLSHGYIVGLVLSAPTIAREILLHGMAGIVWGWLCLRHGWLAGFVGHLGAYLAMVPLLA
jgi:hypothetical protein